jgi:hypothetical protein
MTNSNGSRQFEAVLRNGPRTRLISAFISRIQADGLPGETLAGPRTIHRGALVTPVREDSLRSCPPALVMSSKQGIQRPSVGARYPPIQDHHPQDHRIPPETSELGSPQILEDEALVLQRKQNPSIPIRPGVHERAKRRTLRPRSEGQTEVLTSATDP